MAEPMERFENDNRGFSRRGFLAMAAAGLPAAFFARSAMPAEWTPRYCLASCMYGRLPLAEILPEVHKTGAETIDLWPKVHGNQREQVDEMGVYAFLEMCDEYNVKPAMITRYDLGPFKLREEMAFAERLGASLLIAGSAKAVDDERAGVRDFVEKLKPHLEVAAEHGVRLGIENHANALIHSPDSIRYLADALDTVDHAGIALAPYHLPQDSDLIAKLVHDLGPRMIHFYAWQHGHGSHQPQPKALEMQQLPGYGPLDFGPILAALAAIGYDNLISIFMHPYPRGIPILPTAAATTAAINRSREYIEWNLGHIDEAGASSNS